MHVRVWPSTVQVMVVVPEPAGRTTPSEEMVATAVLPMDQVGVEEVPFTRICTEGLSREEKVKSVWFRDRVPVEELPVPVLLPLELLEVPLVTWLSTVQVWSAAPGMEAVMVARPRTVPWLTRPLASTEATSGSLLVQVMVPVEPAGVKVTWMVTGSG